MNDHRVLIVEDDAQLRQTLGDVFEVSEFRPVLCASAEEALEKTQKQAPDLVILDVNLPGMSGLECLKRIKERDASITVILMTAYSTIEDAVQAVKDGAYNYLSKPIKHQALVEMVQKALEAKTLVEDMAFSAPIVSMASGEFVGNSNEMRKVFGVIHKLAKVDTSVLIRGESGTGKELVARAIHFNSSRKDGKLVALNCSSIAENLFESELFGHERGAFTGADQRHIGKFQYAEGGTLFLDEIGDLSAAMQVKLLRVLQERKFTPVGSNREVEADVRVIAATNRNLEDMMKRGVFREDLFYRLNVIPIFLPPLRDRKDDIEKLANHFVREFNKRQSKNIAKIATDALAILLNHQWPGNIRELENAIEYAFVIESSDQITTGSLPAYLAGTGTSGNVMGIPAPALSASGSLLDFNSEKERFERDFLMRALATFQGRINQTAEHAHIPKKTLLRKLKKYGIRPDDYRG